MWDEYGEWSEDIMGAAISASVEDVSGGDFFGPVAPYADMQAEADYQDRLAADLAASSQSGIMAQAGSDYAARLAADFARLGLSATGAALNTATGAVRTTAGTVAQQVGAAVNTAALPYARPAATVSSSFNFSWQEAAIALVVVFAGYKVARAL